VSYELSFLQVHFTHSAALINEMIMLDKPYELKVFSAVSTESVSVKFRVPPRLRNIRH